MTADRLNQITGQIVDAAMEVHSHLGPGLLERSYQACLSHEIRTRGLQVRCQLHLPLVYKGVQLDLGYRIDMLVDDAGLLLNFKTARLRDGIKRMVNGL